MAILIQQPNLSLNRVTELGVSSAYFFPRQADRTSVNENRESNETIHRFQTRPIFKQCVKCLKNMKHSLGFFFSSGTFLRHSLISNSFFFSVPFCRIVRVDNAPTQHILSYPFFFCRCVACVLWLFVLFDSLRSFLCRFDCRIDSLE